MYTSIMYWLAPGGLVRVYFQETEVRSAVLSTGFSHKV